MSSIMEKPKRSIKTIEWHMLNKKKFFPLSMLSSFIVRCALYPLTLIKTRLQVQKHNVMYKGMFHALGKISREEGISGLYKGFWVSSVQIFSGVVYIGTYEAMRHNLKERNVNARIRALVAGGIASGISQTIIVPFDVVSQHLMMLGAPGKIQMNNVLNIREDIIKKGSYALPAEVIKKIFKYDGLRGFYRGYTASLCTYVPNSALWWGFYHFYQDQLHAHSPSWVPHLLIQSVSGTLGGFTTTILTNPLDVVRARLQVQRIESISGAFKELWVEEGFKIFIKGLSARLVQSASFSFTIILGYETIKRLSVKEEYEHLISW